MTAFITAFIDSSYIILKVQSPNALLTRIDEAILMWYLFILRKRSKNKLFFLTTIHQLLLLIFWMEFGLSTSVIIKSFSVLSNTKLRGENQWAKMCSFIVLYRINTWKTQPICLCFVLYIFIRSKNCITNDELN